MSREDPSQEEVNAALWRTGRFVSDYDNRVLDPAEVLLLARYREPLSKRVLEIGCGAGRFLGYLVQLGADAHGLDISPAMVEHCRLLFPSADVRVGDLTSLPSTVAGPFDAIVLTNNVLDVLDDAGRRAALADVRGLLKPGGLAIFESHNLACREQVARSAGAAPPRSRAQRVWAMADKLADRSPRWMLGAPGRAARRRANRRRLAPLEYRGADYAVLNDDAHDYGLLHYYIGGPAQGSQLAEVGFEVVEVMESNGAPVALGEDGVGPALYYVGRPV